MFAASLKVTFSVGSEQSRLSGKKSNKNLMLNTTPAVSPETSKEDFKKRYANLMLNMLILTVFWVGGLTSSIINLVNSNVMIGLNLLVFSCIPLVILFQNQYLKWLAQGGV
ncbi:hypothetical protein [Aeromonas veronii]|uniref:hypothetical protein n=1 Tax=Aeromonas veronii TaxID=654 RepID=UPI0024440FD3|nr:hypothetical protein [Aeromonas veronii]